MIRALLICALSAACAPIEADHPLDPDTPPDARGTARVSGVVALPAAAADLADLVRVHLRDGDAEAARTTTLVEGGAFTLARVPAGAWRLEVEAPGLATSPLLLSLTPGQVIDVGTLTLRPPADGDEGLVVGQVVLAGRPSAEAVGVTIRQPDSGRFTLAGVDGAFTLALPPGSWALEITRSGYSPVHVDAVRITTGGRTALDPPRASSPCPGSCAAPWACAPTRPPAASRR